MTHFIQAGINNGADGIFGSTGHTALTRIDDTDGTAIQSITIRRGRPDEFEKTGAGTAEISGTDGVGSMDPTFGSGFGMNPTQPIAIWMVHPVTSAVKNLFVGYVADIDIDSTPATSYANFNVSCVDALDILADTEVIPGGAGTAVPTASTGDVFYAAQQVDDRIRAALADAALSAGVTEWPAGLTDIFSGNVSVQDTVYAPRTSILQVIQDAADAEFPGVANFYASKDGILTFHGRYARFHPADVEYNINRWNITDFGDYLPGTDAILSQMSYTRGKTNMVNACLATPNGILDADIAGQFSSDSFAIAQFGARSLSFENLITQGGLVSNIGDANAETKLFADYYVANYAQPFDRVKQLVFRAPAAGSDYESSAWTFMQSVEISDIIHLSAFFNWGGGFFGVDLFVEGITYEIDNLGGKNFPNVTMTLDLSPRALYVSDPFED